MDYSKPFLGKLVTVEIDRPLDTNHPKHDYTHPINYGFIPDTKAPDGAELDAYVLGIEKPLVSFSGRCIAIIHRLDDDDDKLIVCKDGESYSDEQIRNMTHFQEQWFEPEIVRK